MRQEDNEVLFSQIGQDLKRLEQRLERLEDFMNQYYKLQIKKPYKMGSIDAFPEFKKELKNE